MFTFFSSSKKKLKQKVESFFKKPIFVFIATYANDGVNPLTNEIVFSDDVVKANLQLMSVAGMYDFSGEWACTVGLPAKSGVAGERERVRVLPCAGVTIFKRYVFLFPIYLKRWSKRQSIMSFFSIRKKIMTI